MERNASTERGDYNVFCCSRGGDLGRFFIPWRCPGSTPAATNARYRIVRLRSRRMLGQKNSRILQDRDDLRLNRLTGDFDILIGNVNVDFRANAELSFHVNPRLD